MSNEPIKPALSESEWAARRFDRENEAIVQHEYDGTPWVATCYAQSADLDEDILKVSDAVFGPAAIPALISLANAALPDGSPYKLTWEMVDDLRSEAERGEFAERTSDNARFSSIDPRTARRMADTIAALLPPR